MTFATGIGSLPGQSQRDFDEAVQLVFGELGEPPGLPFLPEVPGRGAIAAMTGRTLALLDDADGMGVDLQPGGWRISGGGSGIDHRRARSLLAQDLDGLEERTQGYVGDLKVQLVGPWTLAATVERPRGDRVLADHGLRRDLAHALALGVDAHLRDVRRRVPGAQRLIVALDEPAMGSVLGGRVPTASGFGRHRSIGPQEASELLGAVVSAITGSDQSGGGASDEGVGELVNEGWVHSCAADAPLALLRTTGASGLLVDPEVLDAPGHDVLATALEAGESVVLGLLSPDGVGLDETAVTERVLRWLDMVGLDPAVVRERLGVSASCGLSGHPRVGLANAMAVARNLS